MHFYHTPSHWWNCSYSKIPEFQLDCPPYSVKPENKMSGFVTFSYIFADNIMAYLTLKKRSIAVIMDSDCGNQVFYNIFGWQQNIF